MKGYIDFDTILVSVFISLFTVSAMLWLMPTIGDAKYTALQTQYNNCLSKINGMIAIECPTCQKCETNPWSATLALSVFLVFLLLLVYAFHVLKPRIELEKEKIELERMKLEKKKQSLRR
jgi:hypothetical protein